MSTTLDYIVEDLEDKNTQAPEGLSRIVGVETKGTPEVATAGDGEMPRTQIGPPPDILFGKPANREQYEIAARLTKAKAVLVESPPRYRQDAHNRERPCSDICSRRGRDRARYPHTTKALRVLRRQVDEALQPLALSVLEATPTARHACARGTGHRRPTLALGCCELAAGGWCAPRKAAAAA
ncbi:MAG: hypothetical protein MRJ92_13510 [Nitrospira sp.]|nr:hypothetical protein [Nitrospira sp.]